MNEELKPQIGQEKIHKEEIIELPNVILNNINLERVIAGHPWIYASQILKISPNVEAGQVVCVRDPKRRFIGIGLYNPNSQIRVRLISRVREKIDKKFFIKRFQKALFYRQRYLSNVEAFRWINSEGDYLSGLVIDVYKRACVIQTTALGMEVRKSDIVEAVCAIMNPEVIIERNDFHAREFEGLEQRKQLLYGELPSSVQINVNGVKLYVDIWNGHKTGWYLDQQQNCKIVAGLASMFKRPKVLDVFSYIGGFGLQAAVHAGAQVDFVEQSKAAIELGRKIAEINDVSNQCTFIEANAFDWLKEKSSLSIGSRPQYDIIILDPPSFTRNKEAVDRAMKGYKEIHIRAFKMLKQGGLLITFSCSHHINRELFLSAIVGAAADTNTLLRQIMVLGQSPDHAIMPMVPETEYLKGFIFEKM